MRAALLLVDLQNDFLERPGLSPPVPVLVRRVAELLEGCRALSLAVLHVRTVVSQDGSNRMPHWKQAGHWACVEDTAGAEAPPELGPLPAERIIAKPYYSAFGNAETDRILRQLKIDTLVVAGIYTHGCVRATILDAYQAGYTVWAADEAIASTEPLHADLTRTHLAERACRFMTNRAILDRLGLPTVGSSKSHVTGLLPVGCVDGEWLAADGQRLWTRRNPANCGETLATVPLGRKEDVDHAAAVAAASQRAWGNRTVGERVGCLSAWMAVLAGQRRECVALMASEAGKPVVHGQAEFAYAMNLLEAVLRQAQEHEPAGPAAGVRVRRCPLGVVGLITPWNNPLAIAVSKLAPALAYGNGVVWKPAPEAPRLAMLIMRTLLEAGVPSGCVNLVQGDADTGRHICAHPDIAAISLTGGIDTGREVAGLCALHGKTLQAELGGNNAALVMAGCDIERVAEELARAAYRYSGQSCTAPRRLIVEKSIRARFEHVLLAAVSALRLGDPDDPATYVGPLISETHRERIHARLEQALREGGRVLCGGRVPPGLERGCWYEPTLVADPEPRARIVQEESFGPVVVLMEAHDLDEALTLCNEVEQGLVATLYSPDPAQQARFLAEAQAGILRINSGLAAISPQAPFGGWKASAIGIPEHGRWDREFYTRPQAVYEA